MTLPHSFYEVPLAHRALHDVSDGRPENSRAAISAAIAAGYGIEIDLQLSADERPIVFHDYALERLTGARGAVRLRTADDLAAIPLTGGNEGIPDLPEVLDLIAGQVPLLIEIKDQDGGMGADVGALERATAAALQGYQGPLAVMSFNPHSVAAMAELLPDVPRGITTSAYRYEDWPLPRSICDHLRAVPDYDRVGASFISHEVSDLAAPRVAALKAQGAMVCCWTVRDIEQETQARAIADNITFEGYAAALGA
ncbi:Glycerophosphoryl diester phosphodiesterase [Sulfitobacter noctilucae]|uniref:glycerophosphodiester phosphodiesterase family protein n=1 Tax=Sulfitobacter noctilucae TaxID=1342302 RepID=UPI00046A9B89|nr:glycerophosphodiester phosphodiesterase family protein [Sulfitobacter noctilucae]KIN65476.1 Glycerophosphoryl diester phosphodiesterase [Sulfitobacter noctilucae]